MNDILATIQTGDNPTVTVVGIQGPSGASTTIGTIADVDSVNPADGSVLVYKTTTNKWTATTLLQAQTVEAGEF
jgi:hypothetical protein